ncbi:DUF2703 domain-containing protein [Streptomyces marincola]|uniref:DUF2703 domain-containing protein n=1 Tax=Streptomyces marincola TaxID=2878388 RepID=A0A1W7D0M8_9ACTN|nr:DUF2703 domain-containing protein [Streptomyces marincola]ARQ70618.1 hypothetical protein CAG99_18800 [Streptomyces marincola]
MTTAEATAPAALPAARLTIEYWTVTMEGQTSCGSCDTTLTTLTDAAATLRPLAERLGIRIDILPRTVTTWAEAFEHGITASPTIRTATADLRPAHPDDTETRLWSWRGSRHTTLPEAALLDFLTRALSARSAEIGDYLDQGGPAPYLRRFLSEPAAAPATAPQETSCATTCP